MLPPHLKNSSLMLVANSSRRALRLGSLCKPTHKRRLDLRTLFKRRFTNAEFDWLIEETNSNVQICCASRHVQVQVSGTEQNTCYSWNWKVSLIDSVCCQSILYKNLHQNLMQQTCTVNLHKFVDCLSLAYNIVYIISDILVCLLCSGFLDRGYM